MLNFLNAEAKKAIIDTAARMEAAAVDPTLSEQERAFWRSVCNITPADEALFARNSAHWNNRLRSGS